MIGHPCMYSSLLPYHPYMHESDITLEQTRLSNYNRIYWLLKPVDPVGRGILEHCPFLHTKPTFSWSKGTQGGKISGGGGGGGGGGIHAL